jgi:hypothetical protein
MGDWLTSVYGFKVEKREIPRPGGKPYYTSPQGPRGILHTTENDDVDVAWRVLHDSGSAPTFITGEHRIIQCRPLSVQAAALRTNLPHLPNRDVWIQIEQVGRSQQKLYSLPDATMKPSAALMAYFADAIPLDVPLDFPDAMTDVKPYPASDNTRRKKMAAIWPNWKGWAHHLEVPWQEPTWHWDCGALRRKGVLIPMARALREQEDEMLTDEEKRMLNVVYARERGRRLRAEGQARPADDPEAQRGWDNADALAKEGGGSGLVDHEHTGGTSGPVKR